MDTMDCQKHTNKKDGGLEPIRSALSPGDVGTVDMEKRKEKVGSCRRRGELNMR